MSDLLCCRGPGAEAGGGFLSACKGGLQVRVKLNGFVSGFFLNYAN